MNLGAAVGIIGLILALLTLTATALTVREVRVALGLDPSTSHRSVAHEKLLHDASIRNLEDERQKYYDSVHDLERTP